MALKVLFSLFGITIDLQHETLESLWLCIGLGNMFPVFVPHRGFLVVWQCHRLLHNRVVRLFISVTGAKRSQNKPNGLLLSV